MSDSNAVRHRSGRLTVCAYPDQGMDIDAMIAEIIQFPHPAEGPDLGDDDPGECPWLHEFDEPVVDAAVVPAPVNIGQERNNRRRQQGQQAGERGVNGIAAVIPAQAEIAEDEFAWMNPQPSSVHVYTNAAGLPMMATVRVIDQEHGGFRFQPAMFAEKNGAAAKWQPVRVADIDALLKDAGVPKRPLYGLKSLADHSNWPVVLVSDEAAADAAAEHLPGHVIVTTLGDSRDYRAVDWQPIVERDVTIWPAAGDAGLRAGLGMANAIRNAAQERVDLGLAVGKVLAVDLPESLPDRWTLADGGQDIDAAALVAAAIRPEDACRPMVVMPPGFEMHDGGLVRVSQTKDGEDYAPVTLQKFDVVARANSTSGDRGALLLRWTSHGRQHDYIMFKESLIDPRALLADLSARELSFFPSQSNNLRDFLGTVSCRRSLRLVDKFGWDVSNDGARTFILPGGEVIAPRSGAGTVIYKNERVYVEDLVAAYAPAGSLSGWQEHIAQRALGNDLLVMSICMALTSPLLALAGLPGGAIHVYGASSKGKTTVAQVGASVLGGGRVMKKWRATDNAMEGVAEQANDVGLFLDETTNADGKTIGSVVYMLADGEGKGRSTRTGDAKIAKTFNLIFMSTGEYDLETTIRMGGGTMTGGQDVRMVSILADAGRDMGAFGDIHDSDTPDAFSKTLKDAVTRHHGTAGRHFISSLIENVQGHDSAAEFKDIVNQMRSYFMANYVPAGLTGQVGRVADSFATIAAAGEIAIDFGTLPWPRDTVMAAMGAIFKSWLDARGGDQSREEINAIKSVRLFLETYGNSRFESLERAKTAIGGGPDGNADDFVSGVRDRVGFREPTRVPGSPETFYDYIITKEAWEQVICKGLDYKRTAKTLKEAGVLRCQGRGFTTKRTLPGMTKQGHCYVITHDIFALDDDAGHCED
ncbi:DUF927 domain-containing protein [Gluconacetobacter diazotrophicus]|uniref:DUF927 domain-containing protein n=1 Tax=Gluconacetobacter diazotrophicus TaxID=33996 RepID=A0A7W4NNH7_GLUDI|nr:DUF927 domain-containing protein [Gluconacetobacter diazotrophicus]MBB2158473.1 DUF927 domain-containing protein [Gluconacetobacter diazotrophicus]